MNVKERKKDTKKERKEGRKKAWGKYIISETVGFIFCKI